MFECIEGCSFTCINKAAMVRHYQHVHEQCLDCALMNVQISYTEDIDENDLSEAERSEAEEAAKWN